MDDIQIPYWGDYFLSLAKTVATRSPCYRARVGCIITKDHRVLSTGYNGPPRKMRSCVERGYCYRERHNIASGTHLELCYSAGAHAEINAIVNAARYGISIEGASLYLVGHDDCCAFCRAAILNAGICKVILMDRNEKKHYFIPEEDFITHPFLPV